MQVLEVWTPAHHVLFPARDRGWGIGDYWRGCYDLLAVKRVIAAVVVLGGLAAAVVLASQSVERDREYLRLIAHGDEALNRGQAFVAIEFYSDAIALKPASMPAYLKRGQAHQRRGDTPETLTAALRDLRTAAQLEPGSTQTLERLGDVNLQMRRYANAAENYTAYIQLDDQAPAIFYKLALASRGEGRLTPAISALQHAVALNPNFHEAFYVLGLCQRDREQLVDARAAFERAVALSPAFIPAREELADLHRLQGRSREEIDQLDALYALDPVKPERLVAVGLAYLRAENRDLAVTRLGQAAERFPDFPGVYAALGHVWLAAAEESRDPADLRKALEALEPVAAQSAASSETLGLFGRALMLAGQTARAEGVFKRAAQRFPVDPDVLPHYAAAAQRLGRLQEARQALTAYVALMDDDRERALRSAWIGDISMQLEDFPGAVSSYEKSAALGDADALLLTRLADALGRAGRVEDARAAVQRALEQDPAHAPARAVASRLQAR
jgi:tetratricopeptide (TPR) repeat protein